MFMLSEVITRYAATTTVPLLQFYGPLDFVRDYLGELVPER